ncbi:MAG: SPL family radical SAM protein [Patescibacteria group bacterium]
MKVKFIQAKSILNRSKINDGYTLNPYVGCPHGCVYCYNQDFLSHIRPLSEKWGQFLEVKINAPEILGKELQRKPKDWVFLSTITDPYNPYEQKYQITRRCLELLLRHQWPVSILTKSILILRDLDLFKKFSEIEIGFTITTLDNKTAKILEPKTSSPLLRIRALEKLNQAGVSTYIFVAPILFELTNLKEIFKISRNKVNEIWFDTLNTKSANWQGLVEILKNHFPKLLFRYQKIFQKQRFEYEMRLKKEIKLLSQQFKIPCKIYF